MDNNENTAPQRRLERLLSFHAADPDNVMLARDCIALYLELGDIDAARVLIDDALARHPDDNPLLFQLATMEIASHNPARARDVLRGLLDSGIDNGGVRYNLAFALALLHEFPAALAVLTRDWDGVCREAPRAPLLKAKVLHHLNEVEAAIETLAVFLNFHPDDAEARGDLALLQIDADDYAAAALHARHALARDGDHYGALLAQGMVALSQGDPERARGCFERTSRKREENGRSRLGLGLCELAAGQPMRAEPLLVAATQQLPLYPPAWIALAWAQLGQQKVAEAEATLTRAPMVAENAEIHGLLAVVRLLQGDIVSARACIDSAEALPGPAHNANYARSLLLLQSGDIEAASALLRHGMGHPANRAGQALLAKLRA